MYNVQQRDIASSCPASRRRDDEELPAVPVKDLVRPLPGIRQLSLLRQRISFSGSARYRERNYAQGGNSGDGSYGRLAQAKADFINDFVREHSVLSVLEFGCGDGHQLSLAEYPRYVGLDVSRAAIQLCHRQFADDPAKSFFLYDGDCFIDRAVIFRAQLALSLDVIYHLVEESVFATYMKHLFENSSKYVIIYATNATWPHTAPHVRHRLFTRWVEANCPRWELVEGAPGPGSGPVRADFFVYERRQPSDISANLN
jgi:SAM-dependent methyltransferase